MVKIAFHYSNGPTSEFFLMHKSRQTNFKNPNISEYMSCSRGAHSHACCRTGQCHCILPHFIVAGEGEVCTASL